MGGDAAPLPRPTHVPRRLGHIQIAGGTDGTGEMTASSVRQLEGRWRHDTRAAGRFPRRARAAWRMKQRYTCRSVTRRVNKLNRIATCRLKPRGAECPSAWGLEGARAPNRQGMPRGVCKLPVWGCKAAPSKAFDVLAAFGFGRIVGVHFQFYEVRGSRATAWTAGRSGQHVTSSAATAGPGTTGRWRLPQLCY